MIYLVDTHWVASALNGRPDATTLLRTLAPAGIAISLITFGEIYEGIYYSSRTDPKVAERGFLRFLRAVPVLPLNRAIMKRFARIRGQLRAQGQIVSPRLRAQPGACLATRDALQPRHGRDDAAGGTRAVGDGSGH